MRFHVQRGSVLPNLSGWVVVVGGFRSRLTARSMARRERSLLEQKKEKA